MRVDNGVRLRYTSEQRRWRHVPGFPLFPVGAFSFCEAGGNDNMPGFLPGFSPGRLIGVLAVWLVDYGDGNESV